MFQGKNFDQFLKFSAFLFCLMALGAIGLELYDKLTGAAESIQLGSSLTFLFFSFLAKYQYAIQYWAQRLDDLNSKERDKQLHMDRTQNIDEPA